MTKAGEKILRGARQALAYSRGETVPGLRVTRFVDVAAIRKKTGLSQAEFAKRFGLDATAVQAWEQKRRVPERAAQVLLRVIDQAPDTVAEVVRKAG
jgi:putative transcriptional regulator